VTPDEQEWEPTPGRPGWEAAPQPPVPAYLCSSSPEPPCGAEVTHLLRPVGRTWDGAATCAAHYPHAAAEADPDQVAADG
jgi:hypothetical protein